MSELGELSEYEEGYNRRITLAKEASLASIDKLREIIDVRGVIQKNAETTPGNYIYRYPVVADGSKVRVIASLEVKFLTENEYNMQFSPECEEKNETN